MLLHKPTRGRARTRRMAVLLCESRVRQSIERLEPVAIGIDIRVFTADMTSLPRPDTISGIDVWRKKREKLERSFREQVERWKDETAHWSSETRAIAHPSYLRIIGLSKYSTGHELERLLLNELESEPDLWFAALRAIADEDPVKPEYDFDESVEAWLAWGRSEGII